ncbi:MerR family transcriptional regulator [Fulvimonas soli]|jgi:DNA-binding transcriptional MerR regulator|uniref:MerR family transcriptional regulator n=1 Tax=Fulvimonas soli TaxID=155197 RepID=A0A316IJN9_9GAMM|nr:MerR family transcriptional regulator [Fulvimonas soli]PWK92724.1 MerR family transcriptional regulator [Fulvimonas soli]TNY25895.1 MerR family transcriptional regulator [Fulvimonas soli]
MLLTVGELARRCGLTVRALHHYDAIGLLRPSSRSAAGYRLYGQADVERLHRIQALRQLGLPLADIGAALSGPQRPLAEVVERQIAQIDRQAAEAARLRERLVRLRAQLAAGQSPDLADWLDTLELMTMYEKYFTPEELKTLPLHTDPDVLPEWSALVTAVRAAMERGATPDDPDAQLLALRWMDLVGRGTGDNPAFLMRLRAMNENEPGLRERSGLTPGLERFVEQAMISARLAIFARYLQPHEMERMRAHYGKQMHAWPELIAELRGALADRVPANDPRVQAMARRWMELFRAYAGDDPATHARIREAYAKEPELRSGSAVDDALLGYVREALASSGARH